MQLLKIIEALASKLNKNKHIHAMWLEGSYANGEVTEHSDIDVWMDIEDGTFDHVLQTFKHQLQEICEIDWEESRGVYSKKPKLAKMTYHPQGLPEAQTIELDLQEHSRQFIFPKSHPIKILFDKSNTLKFK